MKNREVIVPPFSQANVLEYECELPVKIRRCPPLVQYNRTLPEYWYILRPLVTMDARCMGWSEDRIKTARERYLEVAYWAGEVWQEHTPKQFDSPEEAWEEYWLKVKSHEGRVLGKA